MDDETEQSPASTSERYRSAAHGNVEREDVQKAKWDRPKIFNDEECSVERESWDARGRRNGITPCTSPGTRVVWRPKLNRSYARSSRIRARSAPLRDDARACVRGAMNARVRAVARFSRTMVRRVAGG